MVLTKVFIEDSKFSYLLEFYFIRTAKRLFKQEIRELVKGFLNSKFGPTIPQASFEIRHNSKQGDV